MANAADIVVNLVAKTGKPDTPAEGTETPVVNEVEPPVGDAPADADAGDR
ncbi:hypothetical protein LCGC14_3124800, partial [marine sediment metagenome]